MKLEETPSGNLVLLSREQDADRVKLSRQDVRALADFFEILDRWDREDRERVAATRDA
jgi:hypothetical protein